MGKLQCLGAPRGQQSRGRGLQEPRDCWARTEGWTGWQGAGLRGSGWGVLWGWGAQVSAVGLAGVGLPAGSVTQLETLGGGEGVGTGQTLAPCAVSLGPKGSWQSQADPAGNPDGQGLAKCTVAWPRVGTLRGKSTSSRAGNSDRQRGLSCPPHPTPHPLSPYPTTHPPQLAPKFWFCASSGRGAWVP